MSTRNIDIPRVGHEELARFIKNVIKKNNAARESDPLAPLSSIFIVGKPGVGKSTVPKVVASELAMLYSEIRLSSMSYNEIGGWPFVPDGSSDLRFAMPPSLPPTNGGPAILHLEEMNLAEEATMKASQQLLLDYRINDYHMPPGSLVIGSGNGPNDYAKVVTLTAPQMDRVVLLELQTDVQKWLKWATEKRLNPLIVSTVSHYPACIHTLPETAWDGWSKFATPRSWHALSGHLDLYGDLVWEVASQPRFATELASYVGKEAAQYVIQTATIVVAMPPFEEIVARPDKAEITATDGLKKLVATNFLVSRATEGNVEQLMKYVKRMGEELGDLMLQNLLSYRPESKGWSVVQRGIATNYHANAR